MRWQEYHEGAQQSIFNMRLPQQYDSVDAASLKQSLYRNHGAVLVGAVVDNTPVLVTAGVTLYKGDVVYILANPQVRIAAQAMGAQAGVAFARVWVGRQTAHACARCRCSCVRLFSIPPAPQLPPSLHLAAQLKEVLEGGAAADELNPFQVAALCPSGMKSRMLYAEVGAPREAAPSACPPTRPSLSH